MLVKLQAGSVDAGFLAAFCPIQDVPYFTVIKYVLLFEVVGGVANGLPGEGMELWS